MGLATVSACIDNIYDFKPNMTPQLELLYRWLVEFLDDAHAYEYELLLFVVVLVIVPNRNAEVLEPGKLRAPQRENVVATVESFKVP